MKSIKSHRGQNGELRGEQQGQLEFPLQTANAGRDEARDDQVDLAGLDRISAGTNRSDSWVDATVTLLATIVFGLGWAVVELEGADPVQAGYDQASQSVQVGSRVGEMWGAERDRWTDQVAPRNSKQ
jgi:hypothetical protein